MGEKSFGDLVGMVSPTDRFLVGVGCRRGERRDSFRIVNSGGR